MQSAIMSDIRKKLSISSYTELPRFHLFRAGLFRWTLNHGRASWRTKLNSLWIMTAKFAVLNWIISETWGTSFRKYSSANLSTGYCFKKKSNWTELNTKCSTKIRWVKSKLTGTPYNLFEGHETGRKSLKYFPRVPRLKIVDSKGTRNCNECFS